MKKAFLILVTTISLFSCIDKNKPLANKINWAVREATKVEFSELVTGKSYLPVYSHIYHRFEHTTFNLTVTVSIRNVSMNDSLFLLSADYFNTNGNKIREYLSFPIYLAPLETIEIVIEEDDIEGGSGANFVFSWAIENEKTEPLFEAVMISTSGQQGISFSTRGFRIE